MSGRAAGDRTVTTPGTTGATERDRARGSSPATADGAGSDRSPPDPPRSRSARGAPRRSDRRARRYRSCAASAPPNDDCPPAGDSRHRRRLVPRRQPQPRRLPDRDGRRFPGRDEPQDRTGPRGHATRRAAPTPRDTGPGGRGVSAASRASRSSGSNCSSGRAAGGGPGSQEGRMIWSALIRTIVPPCGRSRSMCSTASTRAAQEPNGGGRNDGANARARTGASTQSEPPTPTGFGFGVLLLAIALLLTYGGRLA